MEQPNDFVARVRNDFLRGIYIPRTLLQREFEFIHRIQFVHVPNDIFHFSFAMNFLRDVFERIHDLRIHPLVHILDDFVIMVVMRVHIQRLLGLGCEFFLALCNRDNIAIVIVFKRVAAAPALFGIPVGKTFDHPELVTENILDGDECENEEYA